MGLEVVARPMASIWASIVGIYIRLRSLNREKVRLSRADKEVVLVGVVRHRQGRNDSTNFAENMMLKDLTHILKRKVHLLKWWAFVWWEAVCRSGSFVKTNQQTFHSSTFLFLYIEKDDGPDERRRPRHVWQFKVCPINTSILWTVFFFFESFS